MINSENPLQVAALVSFFVSFVFCVLTIGAVILFGSGGPANFFSPSNIALKIAGLTVCFLFSMLVKTRFDLTELKQHVKDMALTDALTGIYNRRYIEENLERLVESVASFDGKLTLLIIDVDDFKSYNDLYGYGSGDDCLKTIANIIARSIKKKNDFLVRYEGKEFAAIFPNADEKAARMICERLIKNIREYGIPHEGSGLKIVSVSIGATTGGGQNRHTGSEYIKRAQEALRKSVEDGCDRYTFLELR